MFKDHRVGVFVDAANTYISCASVFNRKIDYEKLLYAAVEDKRLFRAIMYAVKHGENLDGWETAMTKIGYELKIKEPMHYQGGGSKADWDVDLCMDIVRMLDCVDVVVLVSGDGDFLPVVRWCQDRGRIVKVMSVYRSTSSKLREAADIYHQIDESMLFPDAIKRAPRPKPTTTRQEPEHSFGAGLVPSAKERKLMDTAIEEHEREQAQKS